MCLAIFGPSPLSPNVVLSFSRWPLTGVLIRSKHRLSDALGPLTALSRSPSSRIYSSFFFFFCTADMIAPILL